MAMKQKEMAQALGVSESVVCRDVARGMPLDSVDLARQWRSDRVRLRIGPVSQPASSPLAGNEEHIVSTAQQLLDRAAACIQAGGMGAVVADLQRALRAVPAHRRLHLDADPGVWFELVSVVRSQLLAYAEVVGHEVGPMDNDEVEHMCHFWYQVACGELASPLP